MKKITNIILVPFLFILMSCTNRSFDSEKWKEWSYKGSDSFLRWDMADDLVDNYDLMGKTKKQIIELLVSQTVKILHWVSIMI
ncbi:MAG: hypothetical protein COA32_08945 [Fluviicola sp.]|nr:MAG: hypothetical protein COA32_08945 [Fluviicola sp.]